MKKLSILILTMLAASLILASDADLNQRFQTTLDKINTALNDHNFKHIKPLIDEDFEYEGSNCGGYCDANIQAMKKIVSDYPYKVEFIKIDKIEKEATDFRVYATYLFEDDVKETKEILMTEEGNILEMGVPRIKIRFATQQDMENEYSKPADKECCEK